MKVFTEKEEDCVQVAGCVYIMVYSVCWMCVMFICDNLLSKIVSHNPGHTGLALPSVNVLEAG